MESRISSSSSSSSIYRWDIIDLLFKCNRCLYIWKPKKSTLDHKPRKCPRCQSRLWDIPIKYIRISEARKKYFESRRRRQNQAPSQENKDEPKAKTPDDAKV